MKKLSVFLKVVMLFITAIWGLIFGIFVPVTFMVDPEGLVPENFPPHIPVLWLTAAVAGFIVPCFLIKLKVYKVAAALSIAGGIAIIALHIALSKFGGFGWLYMPLLLGGAAVVLIAVLDNWGAYRIKRYQKKKRETAPAPSILGGTYQLSEDKKGKKEKK